MTVIPHSKGQGSALDISFGELTCCTAADVLSLGTVLVLPSCDQALHTSWLDIMTVHSGEGVYESLNKIEPPLIVTGYDSFSSLLLLFQLADRYQTSRWGNNNLSLCHDFWGGGGFK